MLVCSTIEYQEILVFKNVGVDYAGPFIVKYGAVRKRATVKSPHFCLSGY